MAIFKAKIILIALLGLLVLCEWTQAFQQPITSLVKRQNDIARSAYRAPKQLGPKIAPLQMSTPTLETPVKQVDIASQNWNVLPDIWDSLSATIGSQTAVIDNIHGGKVELTYGQVKELQYQLAGALQKLGVGDGSCISLFSENSHRWFLMEQAIMRAGACNAVRGASAPTEELQYIYQNSESQAIVVEKADQLISLLGGQGLESKYGPPKFACVLYSNGKTGVELKESLNLPDDLNLITYDEMLAMNAPYQPVQVTEDSKATLVYTSGTTSKPKGVVLRHKNLVHQVKNCSFNPKTKKFDPWVGDSFVSILPCWHIFERTAEYFCMSRGARIIYSNVKNFKSDLVKYKPNFLIAVPRLFETIYKGVQQNFKSQTPFKQKLVAVFTAVSMLYTKARRTARGLVVRSSAPNIFEKLWARLVMAALFPVQFVADKLVWSKIRDGLGGNIKCIVSGGSSLPSALEDFFEMVGERVVVGYGLTETSPVISNRVCEHNLVGSVGMPPPQTTIKIVDVETGVELPKGQAGLVLAKGPQIMSEYMNNPEATLKAIDKDGFFDTGDLGMINPATGDLLITGRAKDTIVLSNGENIAPQPIEDYIVGEVKTVDQIMLVGQDARFLGGIVTVNPTELAARGLITSEDAKRMNGLLGPTPLSTGVEGSPEEIAKETAYLQSKPEIKKAILADIKKSCKSAKFIRPYEVVSDIHLIFEPFTIVNGYLTQTLKVKRNVVSDNFKKEIDALYQ
mmetsp:Transcript_9288/g.12281  ORF Transcript_9288/g.12281 Transcript_9288/m.12281 type:complete len:739 (+) Transcript_9288:149-2365(+)|eukprot:CAMPEP_0117752542 /NCGR_PEP_ID=MMETSP0947-20121206/11667_1 /TAXON_ID=44440 /ORGANISM="Chattonella subsalsa, Strain CCMP2191" /LENGTH=738 /DNA_ID=CAMNT_0005571203 /DNA_START=94 /DNA_END=2310 /DNA_ORIENTATION=-